MLRRHILGAAGASLALGAGSSGRAAVNKRAALEPGWIPLFNGKNLDGWYTYLAKSGKNVDPMGSVRVEHGMIHILGIAEGSQNVEAGYISTEKEYSNYRLRVEYKWGEKRFAPRAEFKRDNGVLYHLLGQDKVWPTCMELQIQETDVGDCYGVIGAKFTPGYVEGAGTPGLPSWPEPIQPRPGRDPIALTSTLRKQGDFEDRNGWNVVELICQGDRSAQLVNGRIVASAFNIQRPDLTDPSKMMRLDHGRIAIEVEYAETWIRRVEMKPLPPM